MLNLYSLNWVTSVCLQEVKFMCWKYSFVLRAMLTATSQIVHINPHLSGRLERQDLNAVLSFIPHVCYEIMSRPDILFFWFPMELGHLSLKDWQTGSKLDLAGKCVCVCAVKHIKVTNLSLRTQVMSIAKVICNLYDFSSSPSLSGQESLGLCFLNLSYLFFLLFLFFL